MTDSGLPMPLVPAEVDLRGLTWMPYYGDHISRSELNAHVSDASYRAAHNLWWAAWNSLPASSLPNDDISLTRFADLGRDVAAFRAIKAEAMHGFVLCSDGRLYHRFLAKVALASWQERQAYRASREVDRNRLRRWRAAKKQRENEEKRVSELSHRRFETAKTVVREVRRELRKEEEAALKEDSLGNKGDLSGGGIHERDHLTVVSPPQSATKSTGRGP